MKKGSAAGFDFGAEGLVKNEGKLSSELDSSSAVKSGNGDGAFCAVADDAVEVDVAGAGSGSFGSRNTNDFLHPGHLTLFPNRDMSLIFNFVPQ